VNRNKLNINNHHTLPYLLPDEEVRADIPALTSAHRVLGEIKGRITQDIINPNLIIAPLLTKEAVAAESVFH